MSISRRPAACVLTLCLLVMQVQVWASAVLGCRHVVGTSTSTTVVCPMHQEGTQQPDPRRPASLFDCQKCTLHCLIGMPALLTSSPQVADSSGTPVPVAIAPHHFYHFRPGSLYRPPIS